MPRLKQTHPPPAATTLPRQTRLQYHRLIFRSRATTLKLLVSSYREYVIHLLSTSLDTTQAISIFHPLMPSARCHAQTKIRNGRYRRRIVNKKMRSTLTPTVAAMQQQQWTTCNSTLPSQALVSGDLSIWKWRLIVKATKQSDAPNCCGRRRT